MKRTPIPPRNWAEAAARLQKLQKPKHNLHDRLQKLEHLLKQGQRDDVKKERG